MLHNYWKHETLAVFVYFKPSAAAMFAWLV